MKLAFIGITACAVMALMVSRILASRLLFIATFDGLAFCAGALVPLAASAAAAYFPARRAARIDPNTTIRYD
jgi:ABC-type lipoprotein release transport system permease subunit